ncbi:hypothetical protein glysoja_040350 [Glycine soja]|uniref:Uncharacterized protein n=1 Tax=Glycine soja TaxID=3848 RepID=A0A0B2SRG6_GLYSO|nr:hypothetical protein glysoja_040350 [Glycine soja]
MLLLMHHPYTWHPRQIIGNIIGVGPTLRSDGVKRVVVINGCGASMWRVLMEACVEREQASVSQKR